MKLYTFEVNNQRRIGALWQGQLVDLAVAYGASSALHRPETNQLQEIPVDMLSFIRLGAPALEAAAEALAFAKKRRAVPVGEQVLYPLEGVKLLAPLRRPGKILCFGRKDGGDQEKGLYFAKMPSAVIGPEEPILMPMNFERLDSAIQFAAIIGKRIKSVAEADVFSCLFGYTILNDVSACDHQLQQNEILLAKNFDAFCPLGPCIATIDEIHDPANIQPRTYLNGTSKPSHSKGHWTSPLPQLISFLSQVMTLEPGDIVSTGFQVTGESHSSPSLRIGDTIAHEIDGIGRLQNQVKTSKYLS